MSFQNCLSNAVRQGAITQQEANQVLNDLHNSIQQRVVGGLSNPQVAAALAVQAHASNLRQNAAIKVLRATKQIAANTENEAYISNAKNVIDAVNGIFTESATDKTTHRSLEYSFHSIQQLAKSYIAEGLAAVERTFTGKIPETTQRNIMKEVVGIPTNDKAASTFAKGIKDALEFLHDRYRANGGAIHKLHDYDIPHAHDVTRVRQVSQDDWVNFVFPLLDRSKMLNKTNVPLTDTELKTLLNGIYDSISTEGLNHYTGGATKHASLANKYDKERILHFDGDSWFTYNEKFGKRDIVSSIVAHIDSMSRDIAFMERFGPSLSGVDHITAIAKKEIQARVEVKRAAGESIDDLLKEHDKIEKTVQNWMDVATNKVFGIQNETWSRVGGNVRGVIASAQLGSAVLTAIGDFATIAATAKYNSLPVTKVIKEYFDVLFNNVSAVEKRAFAAKLAIQVEHLTANILAASRYNVDEMSSFGHILADKTLRWSGLVRHTEAGRISFGIALAQDIAEGFGKAFDALPDGLKRGLSSHGITAAEWDIIRASGGTAYKNVNHADVNAIYRMEATHPGAGAAATKLHSYILSEIDHAVIQNGWKFERLLQSVGTTGEVGKFVGMYKRYPVLFLYQHLGRTMSELNQGAFNRLAYAGSLSIALTVLGAVSLSLKDISSGRDVRDWKDPIFWLDSFIQGGSAGPVGDLVGQTYHAVRQKRYSEAAGQLANFIGGPIVGVANKVTNPLFKGLYGIGDGKFGENFKKELPHFAELVPGNNMWYLKLAYQRYIQDTLTKMLDRDYSTKFSNIEQSRQKNYNQRFWWRPGKLEPSREPRLVN